MVRHEPVLEHDGPDDDDQAYVYRRPARQRQAPDRLARRADVMEIEDDLDDLAYGEDEPQTLIDRVLAAPGKLAMAAVALAAFVAVGVNAAYMQPGAHPSPMLSTRDGAPALALPHTDGRLPQRDIMAAPAPIVPPNRAYDATASIGALAGQTAAAGPRAPYGPPAPTPRPDFAAPIESARAPLPAAQPVAPRVVETRAIETRPVPLPGVVDDPIAALLAPVVGQAPVAAVGQPLPPAATTRSVQPVVAAVQAVLAEMGYQPGSVDGVIGPSTEEAIRRFQLRRALEPNGQITSDLLREIERVTGTRISDS